jgi:uncharacterized membrane protein (UPF0127 family)
MPAMANFLSDVARTGAKGQFELVDAESGRVLVPRLELAVESATRNRGLLGRVGLAAGEALVIAPTNAVHTFFMRFPIDIVFVARNGSVVKVSRAVPAWRLAAAWRGYAVVELAAGGAEFCHLTVGRRVSVRATSHGTEGRFSGIGQTSPEDM